MVQTTQILGNIDLWLHSVWQPQIRSSRRLVLAKRKAGARRPSRSQGRIWGWLHHFWSFAIPKLRPFDFAQGRL